VEDLPDYSNDAGIVRLYNRSQLIIDEFPYTEEMHFPLLNTTEGVALERIHPDKPTNDQDSWHSASDASGYGTPGYQNSQFTDSKDVDKRFHVEPEVFSPNNDGHNDLLSINYQFDKAGIVATLEIYDAKGRRIRTLVNNKTLSTEGSVNWDGLTDDNQNAPMGIYLIYIELFDLEGNTEAIKRHCVLGRL
jgi:hypothetical protein